jgi:hypothetical protein
MERIYAEELATHKSADAAAMASAQGTMSGSTSSYLGEASRRSHSGLSTPLLAAKRQHMITRALQIAVAMMLVVLGGGIVWWQTRPKQVGQGQVLAATQAAPTTAAAAQPVAQVAAAPLPAAPAPATTAPAPAAPVPGSAAAPLPGVAATSAPKPSAAPHPRVAAKPGDAHITVASEPRCELLVDGVPQGQTPVIDIAVPAGKHIIVLLNSSANVKETQKVALREGELWTRSFTFEGGKAQVQSSLSAKMLAAHDEPKAAPAPVAAKPAAPEHHAAAPAPAPVAAAPSAAPKPIEGAAGGAKPAPAAVASMVAPQKPKNVNARTLDGQQLSHTEPHLPGLISAQYHSRQQSEARFTGKVCIDNSGKVFQVSVLAGIPGADNDIINTIKSWTYKPQPVSVCFVANLVFSVD